MREVMIILSLMAYPHVSHANGLKDIIALGGSDSTRVLGVVITIFALGVLGYAGRAILNMMDNSKFGRMFERGCYVFAFGLFFPEIVKIFNMFVAFVLGN